MHFTCTMYILHVVKEVALFWGAWSAMIIESCSNYYYTPCPLIDWAPQNTNFFNYIHNTYVYVTQTCIHVIIDTKRTCTSNPWESNHRDGPMGYKITLKTVMMLHCMLYMYRMYTCVHIHNVHCTCMSAISSESTCTCIIMYMYSVYVMSFSLTIVTTFSYSYMYMYMHILLVSWLNNIRLTKKVLVLVN